MNVFANVSSLNLLLFGLIVRLLFLLGIEYLENFKDVPLTDVDYFVFKDAAEFLSRGESPYLRGDFFFVYTLLANLVCRHTYRYTPLLAWLLIPTTVFAPFGKLLFIFFDILTGALILNVSGKNAAALYLFNPLTIGIAVRGNAESVM